MTNAIDKLHKTSGLKVLYYVFLLTGSVAAYLSAYFKYTRGWSLWSDQQRYLQSAQALSNFDFSPQSHWYPLGYSLMGAFFCKLLPAHPFLIPDIIFFLLIISSLYLIFRKFLSEAESVLLVFLSIFLSRVIIERIAQPWTTLPTHALTYIIIYLLIFEKYKEKNFVISSLLTGVIFLTRPGDILFVFPIFVFSVLATKDRTLILRTSLRSCLCFAPFAIAGILANKFIYGTYWTTPYTVLTRNIGFGLDHILYKGYSIFVEAGSIYFLGSPMFFMRVPWLLFVVPGIFYMYRKMGIRIIGFCLSIVTCYLFYLSYNDFNAANLRWGTEHYLVWTFPLLALPAYLTFRDSWKVLSRPCFVLSATLPILAAMFIGVHFEDVKWSGNINVIGNKEATAGLQSDNIGTAWSYDYQGQDDKLVEVTFDPPRTFDALQFSVWPEGEDFFDKNMVLFVNGKRVDKMYDYVRTCNDEVANILFHRRIVNAKSLTIGINKNYRGKVSLLGLRFLRLEFTAGGKAAKVFRSFYHDSALRGVSRINWIASASSGKPELALDRISNRERIRQE